MAILRGGKRIGGYDIRIGIPRDRSLDDVQSDPRLRQKAGGSPESTIGRFQAMVNEAEGFARKARYYVNFNLPRGVQPLSDQVDTEENLGFSRNNDLITFNNDPTKKRVQAFCNTITMPEREAVVKQIRHNGPPRNFVYDYKSAPITATFYVDKFLRERTFFELWQKAGLSTTTHNFNFYNDYVSDVDIFQLGQYASQQERDDITYGVRLYDCYPQIVGPVTYAHTANEVQTFEVTFTFRYWVNYFINQDGNIDLISSTTGQSEFNKPVVKEGGLFGGLISKLPPEIRRAGRDVLDGLRRSVPLGRISGGRIFPPFKLPPLNI